MAKVTFNFDSLNDSFVTVISAAASYLANLDRVWIRLDKESWRQEDETDTLAAEIGLNAHDEIGYDLIRKFVTLCANAQNTGSLDLADAKVLAGNAYRHMKGMDQA